MNFFNNQKLKSSLILIFVLWFLIWAGYNTYPRELNFSNILDLFHGLRAFLPLLVGFLAIFILFIKRASFSIKILKGPLGLLFLYTLVGIISSIFLSKKPLMAFYWAFTYGSVLIVLLAISAISKSPLTSFSFLIKFNLILVALITSFLFFFFLFQPGVIPVLKSGDFWCHEPYESLAGIPAGKQILGMSGPRSTGFGRYAGVATIFALAMLLGNESQKSFKKTKWFFLFLFFLFILFFSQAKTAILGFLIALPLIFLIFWLLNRSRFILILGMSFFLILLVGYIFQEAYCTFLIKEPIGKALPTEEKLSYYLTLGGRTVNNWPQAFELFLKSPLIGWGFRADRIFFEGQYFQDIHNAILYALTQAGILGTIPFILAFIWTWIILFKLFKKPLLKSEKPLLIAIIGILVFFTIRSITESTGAFFGTDWLILAPLIAYIQYLWFQENSNQSKS